MDSTTTLIEELLLKANDTRISNLRLSVELAMDSLRLSREHQHKALIGKSLNQLALYYMIQGEHELSKESSAEAIQIFTELNDELGIANAKYTVASIHYKTDNYQLGLIYLMDCLSTYKKYNDYLNVSRTQKSLGTIYEYFGDDKNAIKAYEESIESALIIKDRNLESNAYNPLSGIYLNQNKFQEAFEVISKSIKIKQETGDIRGLAFAYYGRGKIYLKQKDYTKAESDFKESIRIHIEMHERLGIGMAYYKLAVLYLETSNHDLAFATIDLALEVSIRYNMIMIKYKSYYTLYELYKKEHKIDLALEFLEKYLLEKEYVINSQTTKIIENYELINAMDALERKTTLDRERAEILAKTQRAEQLAKIKQDFLSTMSHEIRTPLNAVIGISSLLKERHDPDENQLITSLNFASQNLLRIINDILDFTKLDSGKAVLEKRPQILASLLENISNTYVPLAKEKGLDLKLNIDKNVSTTYLLDSTKLTQILSNLISNAINYTNKGHVEIAISLLQRIDEKDLIRFSVVDTGIGIAPHFLTEIFESFSQSQSITTKTQGGTGLGLAIVKKLTQLFDSKIQLHSELNKGSNFYFDVWLDVTDIKFVEANSEISSLNGKSILIVEDNIINALVAKKILGKWGIVTQHVQNGVEAVSICSKEKFDFILMDIHMPQMDGYEASNIIKTTDNLNLETPIFALTADITADQVISQGSNFNGFLLKPIEVEKLMAALTL